MQMTEPVSQSGLSPKKWLPICYFTFFSTWGILIPYWGKWLEGLGYNEQQIGHMIAISLIARSLGTIVVPLVLKQSSQLIPGLRLLSIFCCVLIALFFIPMNWALILLIMIAYNFVMSPCIPLSDSLAAAWQKQSPFEYGKVRLWGSIGFVFATTIVGTFMDLFDYRVIIVCLFITHLTFLVSTFIKASINFQPQHNKSSETHYVKDTEDKTSLDEEHEETKHTFKEIKVLILTPMVLLIMLSIMLIQGSHAAYYSFAAIYWGKLGYSDTLIGIFISFSVLVEVLFFAFGHRLVYKWKLRSLFLCCGLFTVARWLFMANFSSAPLIFIMQSFHAITYVMGHMAMMRFISQFSNQQIIYLQAAYATMASGIGLAIFSSISGTLLKSMGADTFYVMAFVAFISLILIPRQLQFSKQQTI
ncbi:3-phenylpropionate MFS transporter [Thorsellia kenyensis]|uniref:3-phenylpropionate MFS transporter n=1 Tax=Thorsellia kenyensis TaxID=1549888 RepID=A0ABV6CA63_9GAMM